MIKIVGDFLKVCTFLLVFCFLSPINIKKKKTGKYIIKNKNVDIYLSVHDM
jgi:hypothetical protein